MAIKIEAWIASDNSMHRSPEAANRQTLIVHLTKMYARFLPSRGAGLAMATALVDDADAVTAMMAELQYATFGCKLAPRSKIVDFDEAGRAPEEKDLPDNPRPKAFQTPFSR